MSLAALAPLTSGLLVEHFSGHWALAAFAGTIGIAAIMCVALPGLKNTAGAAAPEESAPGPPPG
jgi:hypothetical protein